MPENLLNEAQQAEAMRCVAAALAAYRKELIRHQIPDDLANKLVLQFHESILFPAGKQKVSAP